MDWFELNGTIGGGGSDTIYLSHLNAFRPINWGTTDRIRCLSGVWGDHTDRHVQCNQPSKGHHHNTSSYKHLRGSSGICRFQIFEVKVQICASAPVEAPPINDGLTD